MAAQQGLELRLRSGDTQAGTGLGAAARPALFPDGYNPFEVDNVIGNRYWIRYAKDNMATYFRRRGMVFVDGHPLEPVERATILPALRSSR